MRRPHRTKRLVNHLSSPDNVEVRVEPFSIKISYGRKQRPVSFKLVLVAACALVDADGRVLLTERPAGKTMAGLWEFPGGQVQTAAPARRWRGCGSFPAARSRRTSGRSRR